jgi:hypothetical protein
MNPEPGPDVRSRKEVASLFRAAIEKRAEVGVGKALLNLFLEPQNPFDPRLRRQPRKLAILIGLIVAVAIASVIYFNLEA